MSEEITVTSEEILPSYKKTALLVSTYVMVCFLLRYVATVVITLFSKNADALSPTTAFIGQLALSATFLQILPSVIGAFMFRYIGKNATGLKPLYKIPKSNTKAIANFTAVYGLGQIVNILTITIVFIITSASDLNESVNTMNTIQPPDMASAWYLFGTLVIIAPLFEEFMFRGLILRALKPYGNGLSIFVSGILFGLFHGNINQIFYTAAIGIALGYIANVTDSLFPTTVIHALFNSISGIMLLLLTTPSVQNYIMKPNESEIPDGDMLIIVFFGIFMITAFILMIVGMCLAVVKIKQIRRYKVPKVCAELSNKKKVAVLLLSVPALIYIILVIDTVCGFSDMLISNLIFGQG